MKELEGTGFTPPLYWGISKENKLAYIVMNLLGPSLEDLY